MKTLRQIYNEINKPNSTVELIIKALESDNIEEAKLVYQNDGDKISNKGIEIFLYKSSVGCRNHGVTNCQDPFCKLYYPERLPRNQRKKLIISRNPALKAKLANKNTKKCIAVYPIDLVLSKFPEKYHSKLYIDLDGDPVKVSEHKYYAFKKSTNCSYCQLPGEFFVKERNQYGKNLVLNLYSKANGKEVLLTTEHFDSTFRGPQNRKTICNTCLHKLEKQKNQRLMCN